MSRCQGPDLKGLLAGMHAVKIAISEGIETRQAIGNFKDRKEARRSIPCTLEQAARGQRAESHTPSRWTGSIPAGKVGVSFRAVGLFGGGGLQGFREQRR